MTLNLYNNKINLLYDFVYNKYKEDYEISSIDLNKIIQSDVEMPYGDISNDILKQLMLEKIQYLFNINNDIYIKVLSNNIPFIIKLNLEKTKDSFNDNLISYILSEFVLLDKTSHILLPIMNLTVDLLDIENIIKQFDLPDIFNKYLEKKKNKQVNLKLREGFFYITSLNKYINENAVNYKIILFKIIYTLLIIKQKYKYFSHNNLILDNIFVYVNKDVNLSEYKEYKFNEQKYYLPYEIYDIKITNFEKSKILNTELDILDDIEETEIVETETANDLLTLANDILKKNIDLDSKNFLTNLRDMKNNNIENLLNDEYFNEFKEKPKQKSYNGTRNINSNFNFKLESENESILGNQKKLKRIYQKGGTDVPPYKNEKNDPFRSNDERTTFKKKQEDGPAIRTPPVLLEQTIYDTSQAKPIKPEPPPAYIPLYNDTMSINPVANIMNPAYNKPIQKVYNISLANPLHDFSTVSRVYEDIIPGDPSSFSFKTTYERTQLINFMRNIINENIDGESMNITGGKNSLLSSIKLLNLNPYSLNKHPYMDLGTNFLIYNAAYPIRYDENKNNVYISKTAHGINVRLYNLTLGEMVGNEINQNINNFNFNLWRELTYYNHIKNNILGKKLSPNFISSILYKKDTLSNVHWSKLSKLQKKHVEKSSELNIKAKLFNNKSKINLNPEQLDIYLFIDNNNSSFMTEYDNLKNRLSMYNNIIFNDPLNALDPSNLDKVTKFNIIKFPYIIFKFNNKHIPYNGEMTTNEIINFINDTFALLSSLLDISISSGESIVLLTEAPHSNIIKWASPLYQTTGSLKKMLATGYHKAEVWESILFQIMHIMSILHKEDLYFEEFSLENNIYIKDLYYEPNNLTYWIYTVDELDYYVPNYGYLVLFDSKYSDLESGNYKIRSTKLYPSKNDKLNDQPDPANFNNEILLQFKEILTPVIFNTKLKSQGGLPPDDKILNLLDRISQVNLASINEYIRTFFSHYLNKRIGTYLTRTEKEVVNILNRPLFNKKGQLLVKQERFDEYVWVIYESSASALVKNIITKDNNNNIISQPANVFSLFNYPLSENIPSSINDNAIIEKYI
jgi:hypothetical protein